MPLLEYLLMALINSFLAVMDKLLKSTGSESLGKMGGSASFLFLCHGERQLGRGTQAIGRQQ